MKRILNLLVIISTITCSAQAQQEVQWTFSAKKLTADSYEVHLKAMVQQPWHIYSHYMEAGGPIPTQITFSADPLITLVDSVKETGVLQVHHDEVFNVTVKYYSDSVDFVQKVKVKSGVAVSGTIKFMICTADHCLPPTEIPFTVKLQ